MKQFKSLKKQQKLTFYLLNTKFKKVRSRSKEDFMKNSN